MILHLHRAGHSTYTRQKNHGVSFRVIAKWMRMAGVDHIHAGTAVGKLEGDREATLGWIDLMREKFIPENRARGIFFDQDFGFMPGLFPVAEALWPRLVTLPLFPGMTADEVDHVAASIRALHG